MTRKLFIRAAALTVVGGLSAMSLAACANSTASPSGSSGASGDVVTIDYLHRLPDGAGMTKVADIVAKWNKEHPNIQVKATKFDGKAPEMISKLETDVKAKNAACLAQVGYSEVPQLYVKGLLEDVSAEAKKYESKFSAGAFSGMKAGDAVVGLPQDVGPLVYFYNTAEFDKLGIKAPTTLDEFNAAATKAAAAGKYIADFQPDEAQNWLAGQAAAAGDAWFSIDKDAWKVNTAGTGSQKVASFWQNLIDNKQVLTHERWGEDFTKSLNDTTLIGHVGAAWEAGFLLDSLDKTPAEGQWRIAQLPDFGAGKLTGPDGGSGVAVMKGCAHKAEAVEFSAWFNTQIDDLASQGLVVAATGTPKQSEKLTKQFGGQDVIGELATATKNLNPKFIYAPGFATLKSMNETAANAATGKAKVADVFTTAQQSAVAAITDLGLKVSK